MATREEQRANPKFLDAEYRKLVERVLSPNVGYAQLVDMKRMFMAGAASMQDVLMRNLTEDREPTDADLQLMTDMHEELLQFGEDIKAGLA